MCSGIPGPFIDNYLNFFLVKHQSYVLVLCVQLTAYLKHAYLATESGPHILQQCLRRDVFSGMHADNGFSRHPLGESKEFV